MTYGKIINGALYYAPNVIDVEDKQIINPTEQLLISQGYKPIIFSEQLENKEGFHVETHYEDDGNFIIQNDRYVKNDDDGADDDIYTSLTKHIKSLEEKIDKLTSSLNL